VSAQAGLVDLQPPDNILSHVVVGFPAILPVKAAGTLVADKNPQHGVREVTPGLPDEQLSHARSPRVRVHIEGEELARRGLVGISAGSGGRESAHDVLFEGDDRVRQFGVRGAKCIVARPILGAQTIQVIVRKQASISHLP